jgi:glycerophosphoryl diester phosphodiesterase
VAHRGASKTFRENTVDAFVEARRQGAAMVELDVRRTKDSALIIHHDASISGLGPIINLDAADLPKYVPSLVEALDACVGIDVNIEIKNDPDEPDFDRTDFIAAGVVELLQSRTDADRMLISSFRYETIEFTRALNPALKTGFLFTMPPLSPLKLKALIHRTAHAGHVAIHPYHRGVSARMVDLAHEVDLAVNTWTVDDPSRMRNLAKLGVDAIITNVPEIGVATFSAP